MARRKITKQQDSDPWAALTDKQKQFAINLAAGMTQIEAYKAAYDCSNSSDAAVSVNASRLRHNPKVALVMDQFAADSADAAMCAREEHLRELKRLSLRAEAAGNYGAAVQAEQLRGKVAGHYIEQHKDMTERDPIEALDELSRISPELAEAVAEQWKIAWKPEGETTH